MNDLELDSMLNDWKAPAPSRGLRQGLRAQFPRAERRGFAGPLRWALAVVLASLTMAVAMEQVVGSSWESPVLTRMKNFYEGLMDGVEARQTYNIFVKVWHSHPKLYADGKELPPLTHRFYGHASTFEVEVPDEGVYSVTAFSRELKGWARAGVIHGNVIEFQAGKKQIRIECDQAIVDEERPVFVRRRQ